MHSPIAGGMLHRMDTHDFDVVVIGAGIAGATSAAALAADRRVALIEAEEAAGYHTTGRSAALWILNYGPPDVRRLTGLSRPFFEAPPAGFTEHPLMSRRPVVFLAPAEQRAQLEQMLAEGLGLRAISIEAVRAMVPALRPDYAVAAAIEEDAFDMDVAALHQGFLRQLRARGGVLALRHRAGRIERRGAAWDVHTTTGEVFRAPVVVNAAGAWGDEVAGLAGVAPLGLTPCRRTGAIIDPQPWTVRGLAAAERCRPHLVCAARGAHAADGFAGRRDADVPARCAARRTGHRDCDRPHAAGARHRGAARGAKLGRPAHVHAGRQPRVRLGPFGGGFLLVRRPGRLPETWRSASLAPGSILCVTSCRMRKGMQERKRALSASRDMVAHYLRR